MPGPGYKPDVKVTCTDISRGRLHGVLTLLITFGYYFDLPAILIGGQSVSG